MTKYRSKPHIYTFVMKKRISKTFVCAFFAIVLGLVTSYAIGENGEGKYDEFLKVCSSNVLKRGREKPVLKMPDADDIMREAWPVFVSSEEAISVFNQKGADKNMAKESEIEITAKNDDNELSERSIVSYALNISNATDYKIDAKALADTQMVYDVKKDAPTVLVMHTHGCETYSDENGLGLGDQKTYRSTNKDINVVKLGAILSSELNKKGINTIHDQTLCDYPSYNLSYKTAMGLNDWYLQRYPSISFIFDIHRDAIAESDGSPVKLTAKINGESTAQAMIVCGSDKLGLSHPYWKDNLILGLKIQKAMEEKYPSLMRPLNLREERFNMHQTKGSLIFEIGTHGNTLEEAERCIRYLAEGITDVLLH